MGHYVGLFTIMYYLSNNTVYTYSLKDVVYGTPIRFEIVDVRGCFILAIYAILAGYLYLLVINFINNYAYSRSPLIKNWSARRINNAAINRNKA